MKKKKSLSKKLSNSIFSWLQSPANRDGNTLDEYWDKISSFFIFQKLKKANKKKLLSGIFLISIFFIVISGVVGKFDPKIGNAPIQKGAKEKSDIEIINFNTDFYAGDALQWRMIAKEAFIFTELNKTDLSSVNLKYFDGEKVTATVIADASTVETHTKNVHLSGNVAMVNDEGTTVLGEKFYYNNTTGWITSDQLVTIIRADNSTVSGRGFSADKSLKTISFNSSVRGNLTKTE